MNTPTIHDLINLAPNDIQDIIYAPETAHTLITIEKKYGVDNNEMGNDVIASEISLVLLGVTHPKYFISELQRASGLDLDKTRAMAKDINQTIFSPVKPLLMEIYNIKKPSISKPEIQKKITPPKPTLVNPFTDSKKEALIVPQKAKEERVIPLAPRPTADYSTIEEVHKKTELNTIPSPPAKQINTEIKIPENPFEALLKKKSRPQGEVPAPLNTPTDQLTPVLAPKPPVNESNHTISENVPVVPHPPVIADSALLIPKKPMLPQPPKLHTTVAQAPKDPVARVSSHNQKEASKVDPYREMPI